MSAFDLFQAMERSLTDRRHIACRRRSGKPGPVDKGHYLLVSVTGPPPSGPAGRPMSSLNESGPFSVSPGPSVCLSQLRRRPPRTPGMANANLAQGHRGFRRRPCHAPAGPGVAPLRRRSGRRLTRRAEPLSGPWTQPHVPCATLSSSRVVELVQPFCLFPLGSKIAASRIRPDKSSKALPVAP